MFARLFVDLVWHVVNGHERHGLCPGQRCPLAFGEEGSIAPGNKLIKTLFGFAARPRGLRVQVDSIRAPVELRRADLDEFNQQRLLVGQGG